MKRLKRNQILLIAIVLVLLVLVVIMSQEKPMSVTTTTIARSTMAVQLTAQGEVRMHDKFTIAAPISGRFERIMLHEGDAVTRGMTLGRVFPPSLDVRQHENLRAQTRAAEAALQEGRARLEQIKFSLEKAKRDLARAEALNQANAIPKEQLELAEQAVRTSTEELRAGEFRLKAAQHQLESTRAAEREYTGGGGAGAILVRAPSAGRVLRLYEKSDRTVIAGQPLLEIGDPGLVEIVLDVLSNDAVKIQSGMPVAIEGWGGDRALNGRVRYVEPTAYTKISALGIEEKRVNIIVDLLQPEGALGDGYRVRGSVLLWEGNDVLTVPISALFRHSSSWAVFVVRDGKATLVPVKTGARNDFAVEIASGLQPKDEVILHPSNQLQSGMAVEPIRMQEVKP